MGKSLLDKLADNIFEAMGGKKLVGRYGEFLTERELKLVNLFGRHGKILHNVYIPKENGETTEIDVIYITQKGIFVFESKNYSGWIFGDEDGQYWTMSLPNKHKERFYNPIKQNRTHIKWLSKLIGEDIPLFSIIVFSERCELKKINVRNSNIKVIKRDRTYATVREIWDLHSDVMNDEEIDVTYNKLEKLTHVSKEKKQEHIENIQVKYAEKSVVKKETCAEAVDSTKCPRCGGELVLRTTKKGENAGKQFWGCGSFPKCRYMKACE